MPPFCAADRVLRIVPTILPIVLSLSVAQMPMSAWAQAAPDAGSLLRQIEKDREPGKIPKYIVPPRPAATPMKPLSGHLITVSAFRFSGNRLLSGEQLQAAVAPYLAHPIDFSQLQKAADAVAEIYRQAGWVVRVYLPQQEIKDGIVTIAIAEAVFGGVKFEGAPQQRLDNRTARAMVEAQQQPGAVLSSAAIDRALLLLDELPGISASGNLVAGAREGETALLLTLSDDALWSGSATLDNAGSRSTGSAHLSLDASLNSPSGIGDLGLASLIHTDGSDYVHGAYIRPLGYGGWRAGVSGTWLQYRVITPEFAALNLSGSAQTIGLEASYPLIRQRRYSLSLSLNADAKTFDNQVGGVVSSHYGVDVFRAGLNGKSIDNLGGGGNNNVHLALTQGHVDLDGSPNQNADAASAQTGGSFSKYSYGLSREQVVNNDLSLYLAVNGQLAGKNLDSSERFVLGGASGVRAYPSGEGSGAQGRMVNLELRYRYADNINLTGFYDWGHVLLNRNNRKPDGSALASGINDYALEGIGASVEWKTWFGLDMKAVWARRLGNNPNPNAAGLDQDGSLRRNRFWLTLSKSI